MFARWMFRGAAIYGMLALVPQYFRAPPQGAEAASYGFIGTALVFQLVFWLIGGDPVRYRALMPLGVLEKLVFGVPVVLLFALGRVDATLLVFGVLDLMLGLGFFVAWRVTPRS